MTDHDREAAPYVSCPTCGAQPHQPCRDAKYRPRGAHIARVREARESVVLGVDTTR